MNNLSRAVVVVLALLLVGVGAVTVLNYQGRSVSKDIKDFKSCVAAGNPVMESYPEQCRTKDGRNFSNTEQQPK